MWLMLTIRGGVRHDATAKELLQEGREITAILSTSHKTAKENRRRNKAQAKAKLAKLPTAPVTKSI
jgi:hypothetical protein